MVIQFPTISSLDRDFPSHAAGASQANCGRWTLSQLLVVLCTYTHFGVALHTLQWPLYTPRPQLLSFTQSHSWWCVYTHFEVALHALLWSFYTHTLTTAFTFYSVWHTWPQLSRWTLSPLFVMWCTLTCCRFAHFAMTTVHTLITAFTFYSVWHRNSHLKLLLYWDYKG